MHAQLRSTLLGSALGVVLAALALSACGAESAAKPHPQGRVVDAKWSLYKRPSPDDRTLAVSISTPGQCVGSQRKPELKTVGLKETAQTIGLHPKIVVFPADKGEFCEGRGYFLARRVRLSMPLGNRTILNRPGNGR